MQEATSEPRDHLITEVNKINVGTEATAFVFTVSLLEGEPGYSTPHHIQQTVLYLYTGAMMKDLTVDSQQNLHIIQIKCSSNVKVTEPSDDTCIASHDDQQSLCLISAYFTSFSV